MFLSQRLLMPYMKKQTQVMVKLLCSGKVVISLKFQWISRTVMVKNNDIDEAMTILNKIMAQEGLTKRWRLTRTYEKPTWVSEE